MAYRFVVGVIAGSLLATMALASSARADETCEAMWFWRNQIFHKAGTCFSTPLAKAVFGNEGCTAGAAPTGKRLALALEIRNREKSFGCSVNTGAKGLPNIDVSLYGKVTHPPIRDETESACNGFSGASIKLRSAPNARAPVISSIEWGDDVADHSLPFGKWSFHYTYQGNRLRGLGWTDQDVFQTCRMIAG